MHKMLVSSTGMPGPSSTSSFKFLLMHTLEAGSDGKGSWSPATYGGAWIEFPAPWPNLNYHGHLGNK